MRVLAAIDGSPASAAAAGYGALVSAASGGCLVLAYALDPPEASPRLAEQQRRSAERALALARDMAEAFGGAIEDRLLCGSPSAAILAEAHEGGYDLIAMGSHAVCQGAFVRSLMGSTALNVVRDSPVPVLIVPAAVADPARRAEIRSLLVPTDGSRVALDTAEFAAEIAEITRASACLLHCEESLLPEGFAALALSEEERERLAAGQEPLGRLILHATQEPFLRRGHPVDILDVRGTPAAEILRVARQGGFSLILIGSYGAGEAFLRRRRLGCVTEAVLADAPCPVVVCKRPVPAEGSEPE